MSEEYEKAFRNYTRCLEALTFGLPLHEEELE